jgi:hypothetical protein
MKIIQWRVYRSTTDECLREIAAGIVTGVLLATAPFWLVVFFGR